MGKGPKVTYHVHDPENGHTHDAKDLHDAWDYAMDDFLTNTPVHLETRHDGKTVKTETIDPKQWKGHTHSDIVKGVLNNNTFAFRN